MPGWVAKRLGNGLFGLIDVDNPTSAPEVTAAVTAPNYDTFTRIMQEQFNNDEEIRKDWSYPYEYVAIAPNGSLVSNTVWDCVRCEWNNGHKIRVQYQSGISWNNRNVGWGL